MARLPKLYDDDNDRIVVDLDGAPLRPTRQLDLTLRTPAPKLIERWPLTTGFLEGAPVGPIADGIARGERWMVGPAPFAPLGDVVWLRPLDLPYRDQLAAWRVRRRSS